MIVPKKSTHDTNIQPKIDNSKGDTEGIPKVSPEETFICPFCRQTSNNLEMLRVHIEDIHFQHKNIIPQDEIETASGEHYVKCKFCDFSGTDDVSYSEYT